MNSDEQNDRLVDMLLWESVGEEVPPDVRDRVLKAADQVPRRVAPRRHAPNLAVHRSSKRPKAPAFAIAAILTLVAGAGAYIYSQRISTARTPVLTAVSGTVDRAVGAIPLGENLSVGPDSSAVLTYQDGSRVELSPETSIVVTERSWWDGSKGIEIESGSVVAEVARQHSGAPFVLTTGDASAEVVGTKLAIALDDDRTRLEVTEGAVRFIPRKVGREVLVETGFFAESGKSGFRHEKIPVPGITRFTLMNAESDRPIREEALVDGEVISLGSLPTRRINIRADYEGEPPAFVRIRVTRGDRGPTGLPPHASDAHEHPPYFVAGDHWADGRPEDCQSWTPRPGLYHVRAEAIYTDDRKDDPGKPLQIKLRVTK